MRAWRRIAAAFDEEMRPQLLLPFPDEKTIDMRRACSILHVSKFSVHRLFVTPLTPGSEEMCLRAYNTRRNAPMRIEYESLVRFLDRLRERHGIADRRASPTWGRHRDEELLPFPWSDTISVQDASEALSIHISKVLLRIEAGNFEAYQIWRLAPWRISRIGLSKYIESFKSNTGAGRPYKV